MLEQQQYLEFQLSDRHNFDIVIIKDSLGHEYVAKKIKGTNNMYRIDLSEKTNKK